MWSLVHSAEYSSRLKRLAKSHRREVDACHSNLNRYLQALLQGTAPKQIQGGWIHSEPMDVVALDERGGGKKEGGKNKGKGLVPIRLCIPFCCAQGASCHNVGIKSCANRRCWGVKALCHRTARIQPTRPARNGKRKSRLARTMRG